MAQPIISVEHLSKKYRIAHRGKGRSQYSTLREAIAGGAKNLVSNLTPGKRPPADTAPSQEDFWALKDVSFDVQQGEVLGIIGRNGAGKSTLLKILSRITEPTEGRVTLRGRVASLLEVGTGFHPELTGRENIYLNGAILGMSRAEIKRKFDEIVDFAGVEKFLDTPVKRYSSGMYVRLAFAVAAHLEPDILIVDEVLAVGDGEFQLKCLGKMEQVSKGGRTVIFVSHHIASVQRLCNRGLLLHKGQVEFFGTVNDVLDAYLAESTKGITEDGQRRITDGDCTITSWYIVDSNGRKSHSCLSREVVDLRVTFKATRSFQSAELSFVIRSLAGELILAAISSDDFQRPLSIPEGGSEVSVSVRLPLKMGRYQVDLAIKDESRNILDHWLADPVLLIIPNQNSTLPPQWHGLVNEPVSFTVCTDEKRAYEFAGQ